MTDEEFKQSAVSLAHSILTLCDRKGIVGNDVAAIASNALLEVLAQRLGPIGAVERLRDLADIVEKRILAEVSEP